MKVEMWTKISQPVIIKHTALVRINDRYTKFVLNRRRRRRRPVLRVPCVQARTAGAVVFSPHEIQQNWVRKKMKHSIL